MTAFEIPDLVEIGDLIKRKWRITERIGRGGFGQVFKGVDDNYHNEEEREVAIKMESSHAPKHVLKMEVAVLRQLENSPYFCKMFECGRNKDFNYVVMTLQGPSIADLKRQTTKQRFTMTTTLLVCEQMLAGIEALHKIGFLHRDIKPSNFSIGIGRNSRNVVMLDFGLARQYMSEDGTIRRPRQFAGFRGTLRYASLNTHKNRDLGRFDDLWSLFYIMVECVVGSLPWRRLTDKDEVRDEKERFDNSRMLKYLPHEMRYFLDHLEEMNYYSEPDYDELHYRFDAAMERKNINRQSTSYDWERSAAGRYTHPIRYPKQPPHPSPNFTAPPIHPTPSPQCTRPPPSFFGHGESNNNMFGEAPDYGTPLDGTLDQTSSIAPDETGENGEEEEEPIGPDEPGYEEPGYEEPGFEEPVEQEVPYVDYYVGSGYEGDYEYEDEEY